MAALWILAAIWILLVIIALAVVWMIWRRRGTGVGDLGIGQLTPTHMNGEAEHICDYHARHLTEEEWNGFCCVWQSIRKKFDIDPKAAIVYADLLTSDLIAEDKNSHATNGSGTGQIMEKYRTAHDIAACGKARSLTPDEMNKAMNLYISLFDELLAQTDYMQSWQHRSR